MLQLQPPNCWSLLPSPGSLCPLCLRHQHPDFSFLFFYSSTVWARSLSSPISLSFFKHQSETKVVFFWGGAFFENSWASYPLWFDYQNNTHHTHESLVWVENTSVMLKKKKERNISIDKYCWSVSTQWGTAVLSHCVCQVLMEADAQRWLNRSRVTNLINAVHMILKFHPFLLWEAVPRPHLTTT